jgi:hypothetical protein
MQDNEANSAALFRRNLETSALFEVWPIVQLDHHARGAPCPKRLLRRPEDLSAIKANGQDKPRRI